VNTLIGSSKVRDREGRRFIIVILKKFFLSAFRINFSIFDGGLPNYEESVEIDPELVIQETDKAMIPYFERSFDYNSWKCWTLKSGSVVVDLLKKASRIQGHPLR
jgi:hypothetical protein